MPNNILPQGDDQPWKKEVDRLLEQVIIPALTRIENLLKANDTNG